MAYCSTQRWGVLWHTFPPHLHCVHCSSFSPFASRGLYVQPRVVDPQLFKKKKGGKPGADGPLSETWKTVRAPETCDLPHTFALHALFRTPPHVFLRTHCKMARCAARLNRFMGGICNHRAAQVFSLPCSVRLLQAAPLLPKVRCRSPCLCPSQMGGPTTQARERRRRNDRAQGATSTNLPTSPS